MLGSRPQTRALISLSPASPSPPHASPPPRHVDDPEFKHYTDIHQIPPHRLAEIRSFFEDYKKVGSSWPLLPLLPLLPRLPGGGLPSAAARPAVALTRPLGQHAGSAPLHPASSKPTHQLNPPDPAPRLPRQNEHKAVRVDDFLGAVEAKKVVEEAIQL